MLARTWAAAGREGRHQRQDCCDGFRPKHSHLSGRRHYFRQQRQSFCRRGNPGCADGAGGFPGHGRCYRRGLKTARLRTAPQPLPAGGSLPGPDHRLRPARLPQPARGAAAPNRPLRRGPHGRAFDTIHRAALGEGTPGEGHHQGEEASKKTRDERLRSWDVGRSLLMA